MNTGPENLAWQLAACGLETHILSGGSRPTRHGFAVPPGVTYHFTGGDGSPGDHIALYRKLRETLDLDAVIGWIRNLTPLALLEPRTGRRPAFIASEGDLSAPRRRNILRRACDVLIALVERNRTLAEVWRGPSAGIGRIAHVCAISGAVRENVVRAYGIAHERVTVVPRGVDVEFFRPAELAARDVLHRPPRLLFTGNIVKSKGVGDVVDALQHIAVPVELVLCGNQKGYVDTLNARLAELDAEHRLTWTGALQREALRGQLQTADIFVFCSWREGLGKSVLEAMASGLPVVVSDIAALTEVVTDRENGLVVPVRDARRIAAAIDAYLVDPALRARCGRNARGTIEARFSARAETEAWLSLLARQLGGTSPDD